MEQDCSPEDAETSDQVMGLDFHPQSDVLAAGIINGKVELYMYKEDQPCQLVLDVQHHTDSCRAVKFSSDGNAMYSGSADQSLVCIDRQGSIIWATPNAHSAGINRIQLTGSGLVVTGDDEGGVKLWDIRQQRAVMEFKENKDFVADFALHPEDTHLLAACGDGVLSCFDLRQRKLSEQSEEDEDELLSVEFIKGSKKVVCGTQGGVLGIWSWGDLSDTSDRFPGHPQSIDTMLPVDGDTVCTGSSDGIIRIVSIHPNKLLGLVGDHDDFPVEQMKFSRDRRFIGSISHEAVVHFWDVSYLLENSDDKDDDDDDDDDDDNQMTDVNTDTMLTSDIASASSAGPSVGAGSGAGSSGAGSSGAGPSNDAKLEEAEMLEAGGAVSVNINNKKKKNKKKKKSHVSNEEFFSDL